MAERSARAWAVPFAASLARIAPTVLVRWGTNGDWRRRFRDAAYAVGRADDAERVEAAYERLVQGLPGRVRETTVAFIRPDTGSVRIDSTPAALPGSVAADAGIPSLDPPGMGERAPDSGFITVSGERLAVVTPADLVVVPNLRAAGEADDALAGFAANPLWNRPPAVRSGRVLHVPGLAGLQRRQPLRRRGPPARGRARGEVSPIPDDQETE